MKGQKIKYKNNNKFSKEHTSNTD